MQLVKADVVEPALGATAGLGRWFVVVADSRFLDYFSGGGGAARQPQCKEPCQCVSTQPWECHGALQDQIGPLHCAAGVVESARGAVAGLGRWFVVVAAFSVCLGLKRSRHDSAVTAHTVVPVFQ